MWLIGILSIEGMPASLERRKHLFLKKKKSMNRLRHTIRYLLIALLLAACNKEPMPIIPSSVPICFDVSHEGMKGSTRAHIFGDDGNEEVKDLVNTAEGGGSFMLSAYFATGNDESDAPAAPYLDRTRVRYFEERDTWQFFRGPDLTGEYYTMYWPKNDALNFFAYMPYNYTEYNTDDYKITDVAYTVADGVSFRCQLPTACSDGEAVQEFVYAHVPDQTGGTVPVKFVHPFAVVYFQLELGSYRLDITDIKFSNTALAGTFRSSADTNSEPLTTASHWTADGQSGEEITFNIGKKIPNDNSFDTPFAGPFLVMPQAIGDIRMSITSERIGDIPNGDIDSNPDGDNTPRTYNIKDIPVATTGVTTWEPGKRYIYNMKIGDGDKEIRLDVKVEPWIPEGKTTTEIE